MKTKIFYLVIFSLIVYLGQNETLNHNNPAKTIIESNHFSSPTENKADYNISILYK